MIKQVFGSFFRTIGRILAYIFIGSLIALIFGKVANAQTFNLSDFSAWDYGTGYTSSVVNGTRTILLNRIVQQTNGYFGNIPNPGTDKLFLHYEWETFYSVSQNPLTLANPSFSSYKVYMSDLPAYVSGLNCDYSYSFGEYGMMKHLLDCSWTATRAHNYEVEIKYTYPDYSYPLVTYQARGYITNDKDTSTVIENSTNTIINNNNNNTNNIINNQNSNTDKVVNEMKEQTNTSKNILQTIINLPVNLINGFLNMLKSLFIPNDDYFTNQFNTLQSKLESKLGVLSYPFTLFIRVTDFLLTFQDTGSYIITWSDFKLPFSDTPIINSGSYDLGSILDNSVFALAHSLYMTFISVYLILSFAKYCHNKYNEMFEGSDDIDTTEYLKVGA